MYSDWSVKKPAAVSCVMFCSLTAHVPVIMTVMVYSNRCCSITSSICDTRERHGSIHAEHDTHTLVWRCHLLCLLLATNHCKQVDVAKKLSILVKVWHKTESEHHERPTELMESWHRKCASMLGQCQSQHANCSCTPLWPHLRLRRARCRGLVWV